MQLAVFAYKIAAKFPPHETYGLASQVRRAAVSISSNIAEGSQRKTAREFAYFLSVAKGSTAELVTQILLAKDLYYISEAECVSYLAHADEVGKMIYTLQKALFTARHS